MTKEELFRWAAEKARDFPVLSKLKSEIIDNIEFLVMPGKRCVFKGICLCFCENSAILFLRNKGFTVSIIDSYDTARDLLFECAEFLKKYEQQK
ncbi:MAG: hypothetical protein FWD71_09020 [Oscillospiraceae bacterium]|nr:hypothetical protein [Oscillospiraceae bacterium]